MERSEKVGALGRRGLIELLTQQNGAFDENLDLEGYVRSPGNFVRRHIGRKRHASVAAFINIFA